MKKGGGKRPIEKKTLLKCLMWAMGIKNYVPT